MVGADLHHEFRGRGLGYASWQAFLDFLFATLDLYSVSLEVLACNERAYHLYQKLGFQYEGRKRGAILRNGSRIDSIFMSILKSEWETLRLPAFPNSPLFHSFHDFAEREVILCCHEGRCRFDIWNLLIFLLKNFY